MLDVHPPHEAAHTWKDFLLHIVTITVGLLIAIGLEQTVEWTHHRHQLHVAEHNLAIELENNRRILTTDRAQMRRGARTLLTILGSMENLRAHKPVGNLATTWAWSDMQSSAWETARNTNVTALMSYEQAQDLADRYQQQALVNDQANAFIHSIYVLTGPMLAGRKPEQLSPAQIDTLEHDAIQALANLGQLQALCNGLADNYGMPPEPAADRSQIH